MQIEPIQTERIRVRAEKPNPDYDTGVRLPLLDISEYTTRWGINTGLFRFVIEANGDLYINEQLYIP
jgi:hypothetical protein